MAKYRIVLTQEQIKQRCIELGKQINQDYKGKSPIIICMLKGAIIFFSDILRQLSLPLSMEFVRLSSYRNSTESGKMEVVNPLTTDITGKDVIIVEDVVDSGKTLSYFLEMLKEKNPASIKICAFLDKPERREAEVNVDYVGFRIECGFVIGYGLDYAERYRELPFLAEIDSPADLDM